MEKFTLIFLSSFNNFFFECALFSERLRGARSVKTDIIASLNVHANIEEITALELSCLILCLI